jgi:hypothetical protein
MQRCICVSEEVACLRDQLPRGVSVPHALAHVTWRAIRDLRLDWSSLSKRHHSYLLPSASAFSDTYHTLAVEHYGCKQGQAR